MIGNIVKGKTTGNDRQKLTKTTGNLTLVHTNIV